MKFKSKSISGVIGAVLTFILPPITLLLREYQLYGKIGNLLSDATLYLSIADHAVSSGHFVQTARPIVGFVVPTGVPFILTVFRLLHMQDGAIFAAQALLFGFTNLILYRTEKKLFQRGGIAPTVFTIACLRCGLYLGNVFVEFYYSFFLCFILWLMFASDAEEGKIMTGLNLSGIATVLTRPSLFPVYLIIFIYVLWKFLKKKSPVAFAQILIPVIIFGCNLMVNYRETGEWILLENYSGTDIYKAAVPNSPVTWEESGRFYDEHFEEIMQDPATTMSEKNAVLSAEARVLIRDDPASWLMNAAKRFYELYLRRYFFLTQFVLLGGVLLSYRNGTQTTALLLNLLAFGILALRIVYQTISNSSLEVAYFLL